MAQIKSFGYPLVFINNIILKYNPTHFKKLRNKLIKKFCMRKVAEEIR